MTAQPWQIAAVTVAVFLLVWAYRKVRRWEEDNQLFLFVVVICPILVTSPIPIIETMRCFREVDIATYNEIEKMVDEIPDLKEVVMKYYDDRIISQSEFTQIKEMKDILAKERLKSSFSKKFKE